MEAHLKFKKFKILSKLEFPKNRKRKNRCISNPIDYVRTQQKVKNIKKQVNNEEEFFIPFRNDISNFSLNFEEILDKKFE